MTVGELLESLKYFPDDTPIFLRAASVENRDGMGDMTCVLVTDVALTAPMLDWDGRDCAVIMNTLASQSHNRQ